MEKKEESKKDFNDIYYRFSFVLSVKDLKNESSEDVIICKRDFNIYNFNEDSLYSLELKECVDECVNMVKMDLKSKTRTYMWYMYDEDCPSSEFTEPMPEKTQTLFKFTLYDDGKSFITKAWSGDEYPFVVRNNVDLTNKKYKYGNDIKLDFVKEIMLKASVDKPDLTTKIMKHISSTCSSYITKEGELCIYKNSDPDTKFEEIRFNKDGSGLSFINNKVKYSHILKDNEKNEVKLVYNGYTNKTTFGKKEYILSKPFIKLI